MVAGFRAPADRVAAVRDFVELMDPVKMNCVHCVHWEENAIVCQLMGIIMKSSFLFIVIAFMPGVVCADYARQVHRLQASDGALRDGFGFSVAVEGDFVVVGADNIGENSGAVYVFDRVTGDEVYKLRVDDADATAAFGHSVAISGSALVVGARLDDIEAPNSGSAYVFDLVSGEQALKLFPGGGEVNDWFGTSVGIDGSIIIVGSPQEDDSGEDSGAAYLFDIKNGQALHKLTPNEGGASRLFGGSVAISGKLAVVGARMPGL